MNSNFRRHALLALTVLVSLGLSGCNTMHGLGKDTEKAGEKIQEESDKAQNQPKHREGDRTEAEASQAPAS